jgi:hypothetical protein
MSPGVCLLKSPFTFPLLMLPPTIDTLLAMMSVLLSLLLTLRTWAQSRAALQLEVLALRHQLQVLQRTRLRRLPLGKADRWLWSLLSRTWTGWRAALIIVKLRPSSPGTGVASDCGGRGSRRRMGRPTLTPDVRTLIRTMAQANRCWGAPRIHSELRKLGSTSVRRLSRNTCTSAPASIADLAHVSEESHWPDRGGRFLRRPDSDLPAPVRPGAPRP